MEILTQMAAISNCTLIKGTDVPSIPEFYFDFNGNSMYNGSRYSIMDRDVLRCQKDDITTSVMSDEGLDFSVNPLVVALSGPDQVEIAANIHEVDQVTQSITLRFLNPNKVLYPDLVLQIKQTKSIFRFILISTQRDDRLAGACYCVVDNDNCGDGCMISQETIIP
jgi:hypothetical protein